MQNAKGQRRKFFDAIFISRRDRGYRVSGTTRPSHTTRESTSTYYAGTHAITVINVRVKRYPARVMVTCPVTIFACSVYRRVTATGNFFAKNNHDYREIRDIVSTYVSRFPYLQVFHSKFENRVFLPFQHFFP